MFDISETSTSSRDPEDQVAAAERPEIIATLDRLTFVYPNGTHALSGLSGFSADDPDFTYAKRVDMSYLTSALKMVAKSK